jgi:heat shock protein HslJ
MLSRLIAFVLLPILCSAAVAQDLRVLNGAASHGAPVALPPDAVLLVEVTAADGARIAEARIPAADGRSPIPFEIGIPDDVAGALRAGRAMEGRLAWLGDAVAVAPGISGDIGDVVLRPFQPMGFVATFRCGDQLIRLGFAGENAVLDTGDGRAILAPSRAASGARYEAEGDADTSIWTRGDSALVSLEGVDLPECHIALPMDETPYRAGGNEPFWSVTLDAGQMTLARLGMDDLAMPVTETGLTQAGDILVIASDPDRALRAVIQRAPTLCRDSMTGMPHPETVALSMGDHTIRGCGGDPWSLLAGRTWVVEDIGGAGVIDSARATMGFDAAARVQGAGSCNRYNAAVTLTGETLSFGAIGSTRMACAEALMVQEQRLFGALSDVSGFDIDDTGALVLRGPGGPLVRARAAQ